MRRIMISCLALAFALSTQAQDKPFRAGVKLGFPNIAGLNVEYVSPLLGGKLAGSVDFSRFTFSSGSDELKYTYFEIGANYYFFKEGKGLYGNFGYGNIGFDASVADDSSLGRGTGKGDISISLLNLKIGAKLGGTFYFRPEIGFGLPFGDSDLEVSYTYTDSATNTTITETEKEDVPIKPGLVANIGIGLAF